jgi:ATP-binding cassette subfamily B protein
MFFLMSWTGQHVLRALRVDVFRHLQQLSLSYYAEHEAGDVMSRITNDATAIEQAFGFALVQVFSGSLLLTWFAYSMIAKSVPFGLLSLSVAPVMIIATFWFSDQARKAFRKSRVEMGSVNANLQESIAAVREAQAFNRAEENIENFRVTNAANRDANVRAVAFTAAMTLDLQGEGNLKVQPVDPWVTGYTFALTLRGGESGCVDIDQRTIQPFHSTFGVP